ncbi:M23 family metallopeptidase [Staphylococcus pettenkoferi]|uniref:lysostaphin n=1 Tax=Staphylococcus pettenkoferi TaxID=170573 RepID=A0A9Q4D577_9STAP|nr:M23 family metallopeptidase [Staphylococcus pettenkoferi]MCY1569673.1 M23 family metallopeptidase [Staphylococcus pettenkoferi]MCY1576059.1 M23 family metallopeptidase [Staphylococcus pettenkoferi]MCY1594154.1 M23 family metallopeptidase [Staphylococcus pettenkoferi]MCY1617672.1 M23 family metallopeptidase [Staphylococcus pettenkoferi]
MTHEILNDIEQNNYKTIYKLLSKSFKKKLKKRNLKKIFKRYNSYQFNHVLCREMDWNGGKRYIWLDINNGGGIRLDINSESVIVGLLFKIFESTGEAKETNLEYTMPINDRWMVFWGGDNELLNYHYVYKNQRYAYDLFVNDEGKTYANNPKSNNNYYAFNKDVVAPADGTILDVENEVYDNEVGTMNVDQPGGNYVVIKHRNDEYSFIAHFKQYSIVKAIGDEVKQGELLGQCGNSGNSSEPHIHFQVMNRPCLNSCESLKIRFCNGTEPILGDTVTSQ